MRLSGSASVAPPQAAKLSCAACDDFSQPDPTGGCAPAPDGLAGRRLNEAHQQGVAVELAAGGPVTNALMFT